jgi:hypothetical protein
VFKRFNILSKSAYSALLMLSLYPSEVLSDWDALNMREGVTQVSRDVFELDIQRKETQIHQPFMKAQSSKLRGL